jgi:signal transduction histidine kinase
MLNEAIDTMECVGLYTEDKFVSTDGIILQANNYPNYFAALRHDRFIVANDAHTHHDTAEFSAGYLTPLDIYSMLDAPIRKDGKIVGVLCCESVGHQHLWNIVEQSFAGMLADLAGRALVEKERKSAQKLLEEANASLERQVEIRTQDLTNTLNTLRSTQTQLIENEKMASLGNLVAGVAHEVNTPLGISITANSHLHNTVEQLSKLYQENALTATQFKESMQTILEASRILTKNLSRAARLVSSFKQVAVNQSDEAIVSFSFCDTLNDILNSLKHSLKINQITFQISCHESLVFESYPGAITQVVTNLTMNSIAHAFENDSTDKKITIEVEETDNNVTIIFEDNGQGIDEAIQNKVFDPFFTTKRGRGGSGLGLNIVHNIVIQQLQGSIELHSELGKGSKFIITLPKLLV